MNIIELAKEAGLAWVARKRLERFAALVLKAEADETRARFTQTEQPEREWIDLTEDEIEDAVGYGINKAGILACRAVIAAFKEKNK